MSDAKSKIPKFRSKAEEREFLETHEALDYFEPKDFVPLAPLLKGKKLVHIYVAPDGTRYEIRKLSSKRPAKNKSRTRKEPFLVG